MKKIVSFLFSDTKSQKLNAIRLFFNLKECEVPRKAQRKTFCLLTFQITDWRGPEGSLFLLDLPEKTSNLERGKYEIVKIITVIV